MALNPEEKNRAMDAIKEKLRPALEKLDGKWVIINWKTGELIFNTSSRDEMLDFLRNVDNRLDLYYGKVNREGGLML